MIYCCFKLWFFSVIMFVMAFQCCCEKEHKPYKVFYKWNFRENLLNWNLIQINKATLEYRIKLTQQRIHCAHKHTHNIIVSMKIIISYVLKSFNSRHCTRTSCQSIHKLPYPMLRIITFHLTSYTKVWVCSRVLVLWYSFLSWMKIMRKILFSCLYIS